MRKLLGWTAARWPLVLLSAIYTGTFVALLALDSTLLMGALAGFGPCLGWAWCANEEWLRRREAFANHAAANRYIDARRAR